jgi:hypothetical protein
MQSSHPRDGTERGGKDGRRIVAITWQGKRYVFPAGREEDMAEVEAYLTAQRPGAQQLARELEKFADNPRLYEALMDRAFKHLAAGPAAERPTAQDVRDFLNTREGAIVNLWTMLRRAYPQDFPATDAGLAKVRQMYSAVVTADVQAQLDLANEDLIRQATGKAVEPGKEKAAEVNGDGQAPASDIVVAGVPKSQLGTEF